MYFRNWWRSLAIQVVKICMGETLAADDSERNSSHLGNCRGIWSHWLGFTWRLWVWMCAWFHANLLIHLRAVYKVAVDKFHTNSVSHRTSVIPNYSDLFWMDFISSDSFSSSLRPKNGELLNTWVAIGVAEFVCTWKKKTSTLKIYFAKFCRPLYTCAVRGKWTHLSLAVYSSV